jgi:hypothetical protein
MTPAAILQKRQLSEWLMRGGSEKLKKNQEAGKTGQREQVKDSACC